MATVRDMIRKKGGEVFAIAPDATVYEALQSMAKHNTGALLVMDGDKVVGILSERDCVRKVDLQGRSPQETKVSNIMTSDVITIHCDQSVEECEALMMEKGIRHLPVYDGDKLSGFLSVRDVLREVGHPADELSMGMSNDYEIAVEEGATMVRLGTVLFGARAA